MKHQDFEIITEETVYDGFYKMKLLQLRHRLFNGGWSPVFTRELMQRLPAVVVLPYDPHLDEVVLIEQFRVGALEDKHSPWLLECVAGLIEPQQSIESVARRELLEEAGLQALALLPICEYWVSPGGTNEKVSLFCAKVNAGAAEGIHGLTDEHEDIRVHRFKATEAFKLIANSRINNAASISALLWLQLQNRRELF